MFFFTSVHSVCYTELPKIPRNYTEFRVTECCLIPRNSAEFRNVFVPAELRPISGNILGEYEAISERLQPVNQDCLMKKTMVKNLLTL
jgi:hypothetical protein